MGRYDWDRRLVMARPRTPLRLTRAEQAQVFRQALLIPVACKVFENLRVGATLWIEGQWAPIHEEPSVILLELQHDVFASRIEYNKRCLTQARRTGTTVLGEHRGFCDLFVPVVRDGEVRAFLITGPFVRQRATATEILTLWRELTGRQGHLADPEFARCLDLVRSTLVLDPGQLEAFQGGVERLSALLSLSGATEDIRAEAIALANKVKGARHVEHVWSVADAMIDERSAQAWSGRHVRLQRTELGLSGVPDHIAVGLFVSRDAAGDPVGGLLRRQELQRACVELCLEKGALLSGRLGDHGVTLLAVAKKSSERTESLLGALTERISALARRDFGIGMHWGLSRLKGQLHEQYQVALAAAESALSRATPLVASDGRGSDRLRFGHLGRDLARLLEEEPRTLPARFDRFLEVVAVRAGYRLEAAQAYLEASFDQLADALASSGKLEGKSVQTMYDALGRGSEESDTVQELFAVYRRVIQDVTDAMERPTRARQDRSLGRAERYMRRHYTEGIALDQVARVAGFAPAYFSRLFHERQGTTFVAHLTRLRVEHAKKLLCDSSLSLTRIAELTGLTARHYLNRVFKAQTGQTPIAYREAHQRMGPRRRG
jgi:AraC-like DNA-binding protein